MPPRRPLPPELTLGAFTVGQGRAAGLGDRRLRGADLDRPFRGVRVVKGAPPVPLTGSPAASAALLARCAALAVALGDDPIFTHLTAARLWPVPLPPDLTEGDLHIGVPHPGRPPRRRGVVAHSYWTRAPWPCVGTAAGSSTRRRCSASSRPSWRSPTWSRSVTR